nr:MAG TPA: hypothetical protein [Caudoviricetes sp.]
MSAIRIAEIVIQFMFCIYAICKAHESARCNNVSFTVFYCTWWALCLMSLW